MLTVNSVNHHWLGFVLGFSQIPKDFEDGPIEPGLGMSKERQHISDAFPFGFNRNGGPFLLISSAGLVKNGHVRVLDNIGQRPGGLISAVIFVQNLNSS